MLKLTSIVTALFCFTLAQSALAAETSSAQTAGKPECPYMKQAGPECPHMKGGGKPADCPHLKEGGCPHHQKGDCPCEGDSAKPCPCAGKAAGDKAESKPTEDKAAKKTPAAAGKKAGKKAK
jgi:hypothetical protein